MLYFFTHESNPILPVSLHWQNVESYEIQTHNVGDWVKGGYVGRPERFDGRITRVNRESNTYNVLYTHDTRDWFAMDVPARQLSVKVI